MKNAVVDAKSFTTLLWLSSYGKDKYDLPENFCNFFWESVLSYVFAIFAWPGHLINLISRKTDATSAIWWVIHIPIALSLRQIYLEKQHITDYSFMGYVYGVLYMTVLFAIIVIVVGIIAFCSFLKDKITEANERRKRKNKDDKWNKLEEQGLSRSEIIEILYNRDEKPVLGFVTWWKAFKGKYCPKISWKNLEK